MKMNYKLKTLIAAVVAIILYFLVQSVVAIVYVILKLTHNSQNLDLESVLQNEHFFSEIFNNNFIVISIIYGSILLLCYLLIMYYLHKEHPQYSYNKGLSLKTVMMNSLLTLAFLSIINLLFALFVFTLGRIPLIKEYIENYNALMRNLTFTDGNIFALVFSLAILTPIVEELLFRGIILSAFKAYFGEKAAIVLSALVFGIMHWNPIQSTYAFLLGLVLAYIYLKTQSIYSAIIFHMIFNFMGAVLQVIFPQNILIIINLTMYISIFSLPFLWKFYKALPKKISSEIECS